MGSTPTASTTSRPEDRTHRCERRESRFDSCTGYQTDAVTQGVGPVFETGRMSSNLIAAAKQCRSDGTGIRAGFKTRCLRACGFDPHLRYQTMLVSANGLGDDVLSVGNAGSNPVTSTKLHRQMIALSASNCTVRNFGTGAAAWEVHYSDPLAPCTGSSGSLQWSSLQRKQSEGNRLPL